MYFADDDINSDELFEDDIPPEPPTPHIRAYINTSKIDAKTNEIPNIVLIDEGNILVIEFCVTYVDSRMYSTDLSKVKHKKWVEARPSSDWALASDQIAV